MSLKPDSQREAVYRWERSLPQYEEHGSMSLRECEALVARVWADYRPGRSVPTIGDGRRTRRGLAYTWDNRMSLPRWARSPLVVLHESAHLLLPSDEKHGPAFATLCLELWARYIDGFDKVAARKAGIAQRPRRVHFATASATPQPKSRAYREWQKELARLHAAESAASQARRAHELTRPKR